MALKDPEQLDLLKPRKRNKYGAWKTVINGHAFHSKAEAARYCQLKMQGVPSLMIQPVFMFQCGAEYIADFRYYLNGWIVEDVKGQKTAVYKLKMRLMKKEYPKVHVREVKIEAEKADVIIKAYLGAQNEKAQE